MPIANLILGYKANGVSELISGTHVPHAKTRAEWDKFRSSGNLPEGYVKAELYDSEKGIIGTCFDEPVRRDSVHANAVNLAKAEVDSIRKIAGLLEDESKALTAEADKLDESFKKVLAKANLKQNLTADEDVIRVSAQDRINHLRKEAAQRTKKANDIKGQLELAEARLKSALSEQKSHKETLSKKAA